MCCTCRVSVLYVCLLFDVCCCVCVIYLVWCMCVGFIHMLGVVFVQRVNEISVFVCFVCMIFLV